LGDPVLREEADDVEVFDDKLRSLVRDMFETMYHEEGIGLAANQIGVTSRVIVLDLRREDHDDEPIALVNPRLTWKSSETAKQTEGCLSIPGLEEIVERPAKVRVERVIPRVSRWRSRRTTCSRAPCSTRSTISTACSSSIA
jgi:peptide deformylase